ncbi:MAG TPA: ferredoxin [Acidimicrobiales bacterium]|nr:ferredoxin [Acidimicrobiales bacterium]
MRLVVDEVICVGHAICEDVAPDLFRVDEHGIAHVLVDPVPDGRIEAARTAMLRCPAEAITLTG